MKLSSVFLLIILFSGCSGKTSSGIKTVSPEYTLIEHENMDVSKIEKDKDGYLILFDGTSTNGWRGYGKSYLPGKWIVNNGCLQLNQREGKGEGGDIIFDYRFKNFELVLDWKISKAGNSGIFYLAREINANDPITNESKLQPIFISAPEYQILDNVNHPDAKLGKDGNRKSGSLYDMIAADPQVANGFGEWNKTFIMVNNGNVTHWLNGVKVVEYSFIGQPWIDLLQSGKFGQNRWPLAFELMKHCGGEKHEGYIGFQDIGDDVWFRNIKIKIISQV